MEELMKELWACLPSQEDNARTINHRIVQHFQSGLTSEEIDVALYTFFHEDNGIQAFLTKLASSPIKKVTSEIFNIFSYLLEGFKINLENYVVVIKNVCLSFIKRDLSSADEKDKALDVVISLIRHGPWRCDLDISSIVLQLRKMASVRVSKATVLRKVYTLIGVLAEEMPHEVNQHSDRLQSAILSDLDHQIMSASKVELLIIEGCFDGLSGILQSFPLDEAVNSELCKRIAFYIKKVLVVKEMPKRAAARAAINILAKHGDQFQVSLSAEYQEWHSILQSWLQYGKEERIVAKRALLAFYRVMAQIASTQIDKKGLLEYFSKHFKNQFEKSEDVDIAVKGFGLFAKCMKLYTPDEIPIIFNILAHKSQEQSGEGNHKAADYLESLSIFSVELGVIHNLQLSILESLSVQLMTQFAVEDHPSWQAVMVDAVICTLIRLNRCSGSALDTYMNTFVYQGLIRTVSHPVIQDAEILTEAGQKDIITYLKYLPFWRSFTSLNLSNQGISLGLSITEKRELSQKLFNKIIQSALDIVNRLDLTLKETSSDSIYHCNVEKSIEANTPEDFTVLVNLTDFLLDLLKDLPDQSYLNQWISPLIQHSIKLSTKHPLVSSFYKLLSNTIHIAQKLGYFEEQTEEMEDIEWRPSINLLSGFLYDVIARQSQYRGDLQVACLKLMLSTPPCIASPLLRICVPAFQSVFRIGCSMLSLAQEGIHTLSRWHQELPKEKLRPLLEAVLPSFDGLLQTRDNVNHEDDGSSLQGMALVKKMLLDQKKKRLWRIKANTRVDTELVQLQKEAVSFLSTLDCSSTLCLLDGSEDRAGVTSWQEKKLLMFPLPFSDMKVEISFDDILPRLVDLAVNCRERQTRSSACELLQAVVMFMLGKEKQLESSHAGHLTPIWTHLFPKLFSLACDVDLTVSQLFKPLGEQLAHWYSSKMHENSKQAHAFLKSLLDGITHQTDAAVRDYSAGCLQEYVAWSKRQGHMSVKVAPVLKFITSLCQHPCPQKRLGAALAFNNIYKVLREEHTVVDEFWFELLHGLVCGLSMCSITGEESHTEAQIENSLRHILRVLIEFANKFNLESKCRRRPKDFDGCQLEHVVYWLLQHCTDLNAKCRHSCMNLVDSLAKYVTCYRSTKDFILQVIKVKGEDNILAIAEGKNGLSTTLPKSAPWNQALVWVHSLLASMESYIWLLQMNISPKTLLTLRNSKLLAALLHFVDGVVHSPVDQPSLWRPKAMENFNFVKCSTIVRMIEYLTVILENGEAVLLDSLWASNLLQTVVYCCLKPSHVGFDSTSKSVEDNLPVIIEKFLKAFDQHAPKNVVGNFKSLLKHYIESAVPELIDRFPHSIRNDNVTLTDKDLVRGLKVLQVIFKECQTWSNLSGERSLQIVFQSIVKPVLGSNQNAPVTLGSFALLHATSLLELFFTTNPEIDKVILLTLDGSPILRRTLEGDLFHGEYFVSCFERVIVKHVFQNPEQSISVLEGILSPDLNVRHLSILPCILRSSFVYKSAMRSQFQEFLVSLFSKWQGFVNWAQGDPSKESWLISLLNLIANFQLDIESSKYGTVGSWIAQLLTDPARSLTLKTELLHCLPIICSSSEATSLCLKDVLQEFKDQHFPILSSEFVNGSEQHSTFVRAFKVLLESLVRTGNCIILQFIVKMIVTDSKHPCCHLMPSTLSAYMKGLQNKPDCQFESLNLVYLMFQDESRSIDIRTRLLNEVLLKLLQDSTFIAQRKFSIENIRKLLNIIGYKLKFEDSSMLQQTLVSKIGSWTLIQQIYGFPTPSLLEGPGSELVHAAFPQTQSFQGKELTKEVTAKAVEALKSSPDKRQWSEESKEIYRKFMCAVYNAFATLVCNLKKSPSDAKFYEKFLFDDKSKIIWFDLVDSKKSYTLPYEQTEHLRKVERVVSIRSQVKEENKSIETPFQKTLHLLESQSLIAGSLESDITRFDFTHSRAVNNSGNRDSLEDKPLIYLESDALNDHECMATVCSVIEHMVKCGISPPPTTECDQVLPVWMNSFKNSMLHHDCPRNSSIFLLRVILNCEKMFFPYAIHLITPILECITRHCLGNGISYLLGDLLGLLVKWSSVKKSVRIDRSIANKLFHYLVKNCYSTKKVVLKYHLELIKSVLDVWKEYVDPPFDALEDMLNNSDKRLGINLIAIMLSYDLAPWKDGNKKLFLNFLFSNLKDAVKEVFKASSETLGLALKLLSKDFGGQLSHEDDIFLTQLTSYLKSLHLQQRDFDRFLTVLYGVHEYYPAIVDPFVWIILFYLDQSTGEKKALLLGLLAKALHVLGESAYKEFQSKNLLEMLKDRNSDVQVQALHIISKVAPSLSYIALQEVIQEISSVYHLVKGEARMLVHQIALIAFDSLKNSASTLSEMEANIFNQSKALLLLGLVDTNMELQKKSFDEWTKEERLPSNAPQRLTTILSLMYSPMTEQHFLRYSVPLVLEGTAITPDYNSAVFEHALEDCNQQEYNIPSSYRSQYIPMAPMFAQSLSSQMSRSDSLDASLNDASLQLLATQNSLTFEPTVDAIDGSDGQNPYFSINSKSSLLFSQGRGSSSSQGSLHTFRKNFKQGTDFGSQRLKLSEQNVAEDSKTNSLLFRHQRYLPKNTASRVYAWANVRKANRRNEMLKESSKRREREISLFRKYRKGDFPDIQLKFHEFIRPLQELAKRDNVIARKVMVALFVGVKELPDSSFEIGNFQGDVVRLLNTILELSTNFEPSTIGTCLEIAYQCGLRLKENLISEAAKNSDLLALGVLLLEFMVYERENENIWLLLTELYDGLGERDIAQAILLYRVPLGQKSKAALKAHAEEQWLKARNLYFEALDETKYDNFYESCFECMAVLSEWGKINTLIRDEVDGCLDNLWAIKWYEKKLLPRLLHSEVLTIIHENRDEHEFMTVMSGWLADDQKGAVLKDHFSELLSIICLVKKNFPQSRFFGSKALSKFVCDWNDLSPLFRKRREAILLSVQNIAELMSFFSGGKEIQHVDDCSDFLKKIEHVLPFPEDSLMLWETRISYRIACLNCMPVEMQAQVKEASLKMQLSLIEAALQQGNHDFAKKYITNIKSKVDSSSPVIRTRWLLDKCWERHQWAEKEQNSVKRLDNLLQIWVQLDRIVASDDLDDNPELSVAAHTEESKLSFSIWNLLSKEPDSLKTLKAQNCTISDWLNRKLQSGSSSSSSDIIVLLERIGLSSLVHSKNIAKDRHRDSQLCAEHIAEAYLQIAQYCRKVLECKEIASLSEVTFSRSYLRATLSAMSYGSKRARHLFPLLLQLPTLCSEHSQDFKDKAAIVPLWMYLGWIPQILALFDSAADVVGPLLIKIAEKYPNAVSYPYNISRENYLPNDPKKREFIEKLDALLESSSLQVQLVQALSCLCPPSTIIKYHIEKIQSSMRTSRVNWTSLQNICSTVSREVLGGVIGQTQYTGKFFKGLVDFKIRELFENLSEAICKESNNAVVGILTKIQERLKAIAVWENKNIKGFSKLKDFSPWLAGFTASKHHVDIEIPGQYTGDQKPNPERHVMISCFEEIVQVMTSIRRPVKLTIIGSDAVSRNFLVKFGEDLRQDERVQQLLSLMNGIFRNNHCCRDRQLSIATYKVIPLSCKLGMIEWVDKTSSLKEMMLNSLSDEGKRSLEIISAELSQFIRNGTESKSPMIVYGNAHRVLSKKQTSDFFSKLLSRLKPDMLRKGLISWSSSAEAFYWLRHSFITSYSTMCIAHWLLGVGDRHLSNCLVSRNNGQCIGIDFGHVFGTATQFLPVHELVPFRLSPQIVYLTHPHQTTGFIEETMVITLRALRADPEVLLATMQVFIQEPSLDWLLFARKQFEQSEDNPAWLPALKVQQAKRKLDGVNPVNIVKEDLENSFHKDFRAAYYSTLKGVPGQNIRANLKDDGLTARQQVECLIDLATDYDVLAKTWQGWDPLM